MQNPAISKDRSRVRRAIRVDRALGEKPGDYGEEEPPYDGWCYRESLRPSETPNGE